MDELESRIGWLEIITTTNDDDDDDDDKRKATNIRSGTSAFNLFVGRHQYDCDIHWRYVTIILMGWMFGIPASGAAPNQVRLHTSS